MVHKKKHRDAGRRRKDRRRLRLEKARILHLKTKGLLKDEDKKEI